jgi:hypothetical protein
MRVPQVKERVKESPASALRAMFAGIGSMLFVKDKIRHKAGTENSAPETEATAPETAAAPETAVAPETVVAETSAGPEVTTAPETTAVPEATPAPEAAAAPETVVTETVVTETVAAQTTAEPAAALPLPNYDELTIASLRARLRTLTPEQLTVLIEYEKAHANRADVITMFERRITKLALGLTQSLPKVTE